MTWILIIGLTISITGYPTKDDCEAAATHAKRYYTSCVPALPGAVVTVSRGN